MSSIGSILYPVDFSPSCIAMAPYVKRAAALLEARVSLVHVVDPTGYNGLQLYVRPISEVSEEHLAIGRDRLESFLTAEFPTAEFARILTSGDAATEIARVAREDRFDLIIMPTHSGIFRQMLLGSTTANPEIRICRFNSICVKKSIPPKGRRRIGASPISSR